MAESVKVLIVNNFPIIRSGLARLLATEQDIKVVGDVENALEAASKAIEMKADVIIVGISIPDLYGLKSISTIIDHLPGAKILALSVSASAKSLNEAVDLGAYAYIPDDSTAADILEIVRKTASSNAPLPPPVRS